jgi:uncharacterized membrane protein YeiH
MFQTAAAALDWIGVIAFVVTGGLVASRKLMDLVGFIVLGTVTGIGGGTLRDVLLDLPVFWIREPAYLVACALTSVLVFFLAHIPQSRYRYCSGSTPSDWRPSPSPARRGRSMQASILSSLSRWG